MVWVELGPPRGSGPAGRRPAVVLQHDRFNRTAINTLIVAAIIDTLLKPRAQALAIILWCGVGGGVALLQNIVTHTLFFRKVSAAARSVEAGLRYALCRRLQKR